MVNLRLLSSKNSSFNEPCRDLALNCNPLIGSDVNFFKSGGGGGERNVRGGSGGGGGGGGGGGVG